MAAVPIIQEEVLYRRQLERANEKVAQLIRGHHLIGRKVILFVGRLAQEKSLGRLINSFSHIPFEESDAVLVLVGDGLERQSLELLTHKLRIEDHVIFAGRLEHAALAAWYRIGSIFALTSSTEPFGAVVNEALLAGMPVVCSKEAGSKILIQNNINGFVVDPSSPEELSAAIELLLAKCHPISMAESTMVKPSLMPVQFSDSVDEYTRLLNRISKS